MHSEITTVMNVIKRSYLFQVPCELEPEESKVLLDYTREIARLVTTNTQLNKNIANAHRILTEEMKIVSEIPTICLPDHYLQLRQALDFLEGKDV